jgi:hypothetical protein
MCFKNTFESSQLLYVCAAKNDEKTDNNAYTNIAHFIMQPSDQVRTEING